ncbi:uncharacterized protein LOC126253075 [Schistocerca nitens]|uniref:uncharacterized protein LOC126253075 n=1 Tax=Schistocerca nitens TaxID=7011 RepID=UPI0021191CD1|nr:uncharacterized protein LOC126253075 [Schistocerca nitens]
MLQKAILWPACFFLHVCIIHIEVSDALPQYDVGVKPCGEIKCSLFEFCAAKHSPHCRECSEVCAEKGPATDHQTCSEKCQEYVYEKKFEDWYKRVDSDMSSLRKLSLIGVVLATAALLFIGFFLLVHLNTRLKPLLFGLSVTKKKASSTAAVINSDKNHASSSAANSNLRLMVPKPDEQTTITDLPSAGATTTTTFGTTSIPSTPYCGKNGAITPATMSTPLSTRPPRHPSEDATLEHAYDNHGLSRSSENVLDESVSPNVSRAKESSF